MTSTNELTMAVFDEDINELPMAVFDDDTADVPESAYTTSLLELAKDQFKQGAVDLALGIVPQSLQNLYQGRPALDPDVIHGSNQAMAQDNQDRATAAAQLGLDVKNLQPKTIDEQIVANLARAGADPMSFIGGIGPKLARPIIAGLESAFGTVWGTVGGEIAAQGVTNLPFVEEGDKAHQAARIIGGGLGGMATTATVSGGIRAASAATSAAVKVGDKLKGKVGSAVEEGETYVATAQVANFINDALTSDPKTADKIAHVEAVLSDFPDLDIGPWVAMTDNPVFQDNLHYLLRTNPAFHGQLKTQIKDAEDAIQAKKEALFKKDGYTAETAIFKELEKGLANARSVITNVDKAIQTVTTPIAPSKVRTPQQIGKIVVQLIERKKKAVRSQMKPLYDNLFNKAEADGVVFNRNQTESLYTFATSEVKELFGLMPPEYRQVINKWKAVKVRDADGKVIKGEDGEALMEYPEASLRQLDSLKRSINKGLRDKNIQGDSRARLTNLKQELDGQIADMGSFGAQYKGLDFEYWKRLGVPLNKEGIKQLSTKKFADQVAPLLSKPEQARQFLDMVGDAGLPVVRAATLAELSKSAYNPKTGEVDILALDKFRSLPANREIIKMAKLETEFSDMSKMVAVLDEQRASVSTQYIAGAKGHTREFFGRMHEQGLDGVISDLLKSPSKTQGHLKFIKGLKPESQEIIMTGLKAELSTQALRSGEGAMTYIKNNQRTFDAVFGKGMYGDLQKLADIQDLLGGLPLDKIKVAAKHSKLEDFLKRKTGVPLTQVNSILRDRIMSAFQKVFVVVNKMNSARVDAKEEQMLIELFTKKGVLKEIRSQADALKLNIDKPEALRAFAESINKSISRGAYMGVEAVEEENKRTSARGLN